VLVIKGLDVEWSLGKIVGCQQVLYTRI